MSEEKIDDNYYENIKWKMKEETSKRRKNSNPGIKPNRNSKSTHHHPVTTYKLKSANLYPLPFHFPIKPFSTALYITALSFVHSLYPISPKRVTRPNPWQLSSTNKVLHRSIKKLIFFLSNLPIIIDKQSNPSIVTFFLIFMHTANWLNFRKSQN